MSMYSINKIKGILSKSKELISMEEIEVLKTLTDSDLNVIAKSMTADEMDNVKSNIATKQGGDLTPLDYISPRQLSDNELNVLLDEKYDNRVLKFRNDPNYKGIIFAAYEEGVDVVKFNEQSECGQLDNIYFMLKEKSPC